jgi:hypothetical protein
MRSNQRKLKVLAVILLLAFSQKIGIGLYLHNWLHVKNSKQSSQPGSVNVVSYNCTCVDDFSMPFAENPEKVSQIIPSIRFEFNPSYKSLIPLSSTFFYSLRGPPLFS